MLLRAPDARAARRASPPISISICRVLAFKGRRALPRQVTTPRPRASARRSGSSRAAFAHPHRARELPRGAPGASPIAAVGPRPRRTGPSGVHAARRRPRRRWSTTSTRRARATCSRSRTRSSSCTSRTARRSRSVKSAPTSPTFGAARRGAPPRENPDVRARRFGAPGSMRRPSSLLRQARHHRRARHRHGGRPNGDGVDDRAHGDGRRSPAPKKHARLQGMLADCLAGVVVQHLVRSADGKEPRVAATTKCSSRSDAIRRRSIREGKTLRAHHPRALPSRAPRKACKRSTPRSSTSSKLERSRPNRRSSARSTKAAFADMRRVRHATRILVD